MLPNCVAKSQQLGVDIHDDPTIDYLLVHLTSRGRRRPKRPPRRSPPSPQRPAPPSPLRSPSSDPSLYRLAVPSCTKSTRHPFAAIAASNSSTLASPRARRNPSASSPPVPVDSVLAGARRTSRGVRPSRSTAGRPPSLGSPQPRTFVRRDFPRTSVTLPRIFSLSSRGGVRACPTGRSRCAQSLAASGRDAPRMGSSEKNLFSSPRRPPPRRRPRPAPPSRKALAWRSLARLSGP